jgi:divalent metal cation (Fe/Co/Zn/Cd) transporter
MAWVATVLAQRAPSRTHTYGLRRGTILAALANAMLLLVVGAIAVEGVRRLIQPGESPASPLWWWLRSAFSSTVSRLGYSPLAARLTSICGPVSVPYGRNRQRAALRRSNRR